MVRSYLQLRLIISTFCLLLTIFALPFSAMASASYCAKFISGYMGRGNGWRVKRNPIYSINEINHANVIKSLEIDEILNLKQRSWRDTFMAHRNGLRVGETQSGYKVIVKKHSKVWQSFGETIFYDSLPEHEVAVYMLSRILGLSIVPPTVLRKIMIDGVEELVSVQLWIDKARPSVKIFEFLTASISRGFTSFDEMIFHKSGLTRQQEENLQEIFTLNFLAQILDLRPANTLQTVYKYFFKIDNGISFGGHVGLSNESHPDFLGQPLSIIRIPQKLLFALMHLSRQDLNQLRPLISGGQIEEIMDQREKLLDHNKRLNLPD